MIPKRHFFPPFALLIVIIAIYSNTFTVLWFFDDVPNIVDNPPIKIDNLMPETLWRTFFAKPSQLGDLYRPVACFSFALNWFVGQDSTVGYHIVNTVIHYLTALFLYLTVLKLFQTPALKREKSEQGVYFIALATAVIWAVNPIHTQAVTYIVQRMASLAGLFYVVSIQCYISGRLQTSLRLRNRYFIFCILSFFLALGSKENAVLLPFSLLLVEYAFFYQSEDRASKFYLHGLSAISLLIVSVGVIYLYKEGVFNNFFDPAGVRTFSYYERLLTQSRVLFFYLSLIFYPSPNRLSIDHDFFISTSLIAPITTLLSIIAIAVIVFFAFYLIRNKLVLSFALLFFFINHLVESTIIPLEMVFEHRNYIPSFFLFLPLTTGLYSAITYYSRHNRFLSATLIVFATFLIVGFGAGTYIRNMTYASSESLWRDAMLKAPLSGRALANLGVRAGWAKEKSLKQLQEALALSHRALEGYQQRVPIKTDILMNTGHLLFNYGFFDKAIQQYQSVLMANPYSADAGYNLAKAHVRGGQFSMAIDRITAVIHNNPPKSTYFNVLGLALLWIGQPEEGLAAFRSAMHLEKNRQIAYYHVGSALSLSGHHSQALYFLQQAKRQERNNIRIAFSIIENSIRSNDETAINKHIHYLFSNFELTTIARALELLPYEYSSVPVDVKLIKPVIASAAQEMVHASFVEKPKD